MREPKKKPQTDESAQPQTAYGRDLLAYLDGMSAEERAVIDGLAELDRRDGNKPPKDA